ncbi:MAG: SUMF1/EgtB/PvdO family nonheme iron enzyme [Sphingobium sp.]|nr:SUMF1/EgtB/PvdO family nonheme iron enzyme [Sphingobium sp.]
MQTSFPISARVLLAGLMLLLGEGAWANGIKIDEPKMVLLSPDEDVKKPFYLGVYEVTWKDYLPAVIEAKCPMPENQYNEPLKFSEKLGDQYPITGITRPDFQCYLNWLNKKLGKKYRLPTAAEWRIAGRRTSYQDSVFKASRPDPRWAVERGLVHPVGQLNPSNDGIFDLEGNAMEILADTRRIPDDLGCKKLGGLFCQQSAVIGMWYHGMGDEKPTGFLDSHWTYDGGSERSMGFRLAHDK